MVPRKRDAGLKERRLNTIPTNLDNGTVYKQLPPPQAETSWESR